MFRVFMDSSLANGVSSVLIDGQVNQSAIHAVWEGGFKRCQQGEMEEVRIGKNGEDVFF